MGGISTVNVPEDVSKAVLDKPIAPPEPSHDGWEIVDIVNQEEAELEETTESSKRKFKVKVATEPLMVARNMKYRTIDNEPLYWLTI